MFLSKRRVERIMRDVLFDGKVHLLDTMWYVKLLKTKDDSYQLQVWLGSDCRETISKHLYEIPFGSHDEISTQMMQKCLKLIVKNDNDWVGIDLLEPRKFKAK